MAQSFKEDYNNFKNDAISAYVDFRKKANEEYAAFMKQAWKQYKVVKSEQSHPLGDGKKPFTGGQK